MTLQEEIALHTERLLLIDMQYRKGQNNNITGKARRDLIIRICARFNLVDPIIVSWLFGISHRLALELLNKLKKEELLICIPTIRAPTNRVYVLDFQGARYAEELLSIRVPFRRASEPSRQINQNNIMHDLICAFICLRGLHERKGGDFCPLWSGFVSETEFRRMYKHDNQVRAVDGLLKDVNGITVACEVEHSFKPKENRRQSLLKHLHSINNKHYSKVFYFSQSHEILSDAKRFNNQLLEELPNTFIKKSRQPFLTQTEAENLKQSLVYRTKFCHEIQHLFYP